MNKIRFKPVFGNEDHIHIIYLLGKLNKLHHEYEVKKKQAKGADKLSKDIIQLEARINTMIDKENQK